MSKPNIHRLEIHLTYRCNLRCNHCHNLVSSAPSTEDLPLEKLAKLLADSVAVKHPWRWLVLHGGESTLHPQFREACQLLADYKAQHNHGVELKLCTNGYGESLEENRRFAESLGFERCDSKKTGEPAVPSHAPYLNSPTDLNESFSLGCRQTWECGIAFTARGFYECSPAAAAWRVFGYPPVVTEVKDLTPERLAEGLAIHCQHCGYARADQTPNPTGPISKTWAAALENYMGKKA